MPSASWSEGLSECFLCTSLIMPLILWPADLWECCTHLAQCHRSLIWRSFRMLCVCKFCTVLSVSWCEGPSECCAFIFCTVFAVTWCEGLSECFVCVCVCVCVCTFCTVLAVYRCEGLSESCPCTFCIVSSATKLSWFPRMITVLESQL